jgi:hypothetical protein
MRVLKIYRESEREVYMALVLILLLLLLPPLLLRRDSPKSSLGLL